MRSFIIAHADAIIATYSTLFLSIAASNFIRELRNARPIEMPSFSWMNIGQAALSSVLLLALIGVFLAPYIYASGHASPKMQVLFGFTNLFCLLTAVISSNLKKKTRKGYVYAGLFAATLLVLGMVSIFGTPPK